jgi:hypothetical protein
MDSASAAEMPNAARANAARPNPTASKALSLGQASSSETRLRIVVEVAMGWSGILRPRGEAFSK